MGIVEVVGAVATALTALTAGIMYAIKRAEANRLERLANSEQELKAKIETAKTNEERKKLSEELDRLRKP